jgi:hypothetical protein
MYSLLKCGHHHHVISSEHDITKKCSFGVQQQPLTHSIWKCGKITDLGVLQFPATKSNPPLAVDLRNCDFLGHYSMFVPFPKQCSANCSRWNITASSLIKSCCYIFQSLSSVCFHATKKNPVIPRSRFSSILVRDSSVV